MTQNSFVLTIAWSFISIKCSFVLVICWFAYILPANRQQIYFKYRAIGLLSFQLFLATAWICLGTISYLDKYLGLFTNYSWFSSTILSVCGHVTLTGIRLFYFVIQIELMQHANSRLVIQESILYHSYNMNNNCKQQCDHKRCTHSCTLSTSTTIRTRFSRQLEESQALAAAKDYNTNGRLTDGDVKNSNCNNGHMHVRPDNAMTVNYNGTTTIVSSGTDTTESKSEKNADIERHTRQILDGISTGNVDDQYYSNLSLFAQKHRSVRSPVLLTIFVIVVQLIIAFLIGYAEFCVRNDRLQRVMKLAVVLSVVIFDAVTIVHFVRKRKVFKFDDYLCIGEEFKLYGKWISGHILAFILSASCVIITGDDSNVGVLFHAFGGLSLSSMVFGLNYIMIIWVNNHHKLDDEFIIKTKDPNHSRNPNYQLTPMELVNSEHVHFVKHLSN